MKSLENEYLEKKIRQITPIFSSNLPSTSVINKFHRKFHHNLLNKFKNFKNIYKNKKNLDKNKKKIEILPSLTLVGMLRPPGFGNFQGYFHFFPSLTTFLPSSSSSSTSYSTSPIISSLSTLSFISKNIIKKFFFNFYQFLPFDVLLGVQNDGDSFEVNY